ncbi:MAG: hypothetical protein D6762_03525 [Candidatus Neomarinimicrobiota bacterium]|nr:MAG: hypothetical protein D6762_03525 [Candidatus Neomarinimicrobiota bacterium]
MGSLPTHHREEQWRDVGMVPPEGSHHTRVYRGQEPKSLTHLEFIGDVPWSPRAEYVASSLAQALRIKLREVIREEESGTYGVRVSARLTPFPHNQARLRVSFGADPSRIDDLVEEVQTRLDSVALYGLPEIYLEKVKETQRRAFETSRKKNGFWLEKMTRSLRYGLPLDEVLRLPEMIESLTMDEMVQLAHRLIREDHLLRVTLYPEEMENQP